MVLVVLIDRVAAPQAHKQQDTAAIEAFRDARKIESFNAVKGTNAPTITISKLKKQHYEPSVKFNGSSSTLHSLYSPTKCMQKIPCI